MRRWLQTSIALSWLAWVPPGGDLVAHDTITSRYDYHKDVLPILERHCVDCHRPDGLAPFSLATYAEARPRAVAIRQQVLSGHMPPWHVARTSRKLYRGIRLTARELDTLMEWASGGAPEGKAPKEGPDLTKTSSRSNATATTNTAHIDLRFSTVTLPSGERFATSMARATLPETTPPHLRSWEIVGTRSESSPALRGVDLFHTSVDADSYLGSRLASERRLDYPSGTAARLESGAVLVLVVHVSRPWRAESGDLQLEPTLRLRFDEKAPDHEIASTAIATERSAPPAGARILGLRPLTAFEALAAGEPLLEVSGAPAAWPRTYLFDSPCELEAPIEIRERSPASGRVGYWLRSIPGPR